MGGGDLYFAEKILDQNTAIHFWGLKINIKQVAQWAAMAHNGASILFGDTLIYNAQRQVTLNLKQ